MIKLEQGNGSCVLLSHENGGIAPPDTRKWLIPFHAWHFFCDVILKFCKEDGHKCAQLDPEH